MTALPHSGVFAQVDPTHVAAVGPAAAILYARIEWRARDTGSWRATREQLAAETGLSLAMIRTAVDRLRADEWVAAERTSTLDATLVWRPLRPDAAHMAEAATSTWRDQLEGGASSAISSCETGLEVTPPTAPPAVQLALVPEPEQPDLAAQHFDSFWQLYPRKVGKPKARAAFEKALRRADVHAIATGLRAHLPAWEARIAADGGATYVPHPTSWLNRDGWDDQPPPMPRAQGSSNALLSSDLLGSLPGLPGLAQ